MIEFDRIAWLENLTVKELIDEIRHTTNNLERGIKPTHSLELLAAVLHISSLGDDLKNSFERWLQIDLWETMEQPGDRLDTD